MLVITTFRGSCNEKGIEVMFAKCGEHITSVNYWSDWNQYGHTPESRAAKKLIEIITGKPTDIWALSKTKDKCNNIVYIYQEEEHG